MPAQHVKMFIGSASEDGSGVPQLEKAINDWLARNSTLSIVGSQTKVCSRDGEGGALRLLIVVTIWCEE
jgi:hypothetical protein